MPFVVTTQSATLGGRKMRGDQGFEPIRDRFAKRIGSYNLDYVTQVP